MNNRLRAQKSFTILEVILAIFVLTIAISGAFALISQTLVSASLVQSKLIAAYLGQEGIEIIKNIRDSNWIKISQGTPDIVWDKGVSDTLPIGGLQHFDFIADYNSSFLSPLEDKPLNLSLDGFYSYSFGQATSFKRKISVKKIDENDIEVLVEISWQERGRNHLFQVSDNLTNWYEQKY